MAALRRLEELLIAGVRIIVGAAICVSIGINLANIVGRYLFSEPLVWAEEILSYLMVWSVFLGAVLVTWEGRHIKMDLISAHIRPPASVFLNVITEIGGDPLVPDGVVGVPRRGARHLGRPAHQDGPDFGAHPPAGERVS